MTTEQSLQQGLAVRDIMSHNVVSILRSESMSAAARLLRSADASAAPVVDETGVLVGVLSATDFLDWSARSPGEREVSTQLSLGDSPQVAYNIERVRGDSVAEHMTPFAQTIAASATLELACRQMCAERIQRLFVTDPRGRPVGVVTTLDLLTARAGAPGQACEAISKGAP